MGEVKQSSCTLHGLSPGLWSHEGDWEKGAKTNKFHWDQHQQEFEKMKQIIAFNAVEDYINFELPFEIYTDANYQKGVVIVQNKGQKSFLVESLEVLTSSNKEVAIIR